MLRMLPRLLLLLLLLPPQVSKAWGFLVLGRTAGHIDAPSGELLPAWPAHSAMLLA